MKINNTQSSGMGAVDVKLGTSGGGRTTGYFKLSSARGISSLMFLFLLSLGVLARGAVNPPAMMLWAEMIGVLAFMVLVICGEPRVTMPEFRIAIVIIFVLTGWIIIQTSINDSIANPIWNDIDKFVTSHTRTTSIAPSDSRAALVTLSLPFVVFIAALVLFPSDEQSLRLLSYIALFGGVLAVWAICEFLFSPQTLLLDEKRYYLDSLTAPFVNRNTAGTFYGLVSLISAVRVYIEARRTDFQNLIFKTELIHRKKRANWRLALQLVLFAASLVALLLTKSRGGIGATFAAYVLLVPMVLWTRADDARGAASFGSEQPRLVLRFMRAISGLVIVIVGGIVFADRALFRAETQGLDDGRFCVARAILKAAQDNEMTGVGFATFRLFFPAYRDPLCGISQVWDRAHSVYLEAFLGVGVMFFAVLIVGVGTLVWTFVRGVGARRSLRPYSVLGLASLILVLIHSSIDFSLQVPGFAAVFAAVMAALVTISRGRTSASTNRNGRTQRIGKIRPVE